MATQGSYNGHEGMEAETKTSKTNNGHTIKEYHAGSDTKVRYENRGKGNGDYRRRDNGNYRNGEGRRDGQSGEYRSRDNGNGEYRKRDNNGYHGGERKKNGPAGDYKSRDNRNGEGRPGGFKPKDNRNSYGGGYNPYKDKDEDEGKKVYRSAKPKSSDSHKEANQDKFETIKRLEREQKTIKKKESKRNKTESTRPQQKQKRQNNRNYLSDYESGMYDDYEDFE